jgi:hypothetical protein
MMNERIRELAEDAGYPDYIGLGLELQSLRVEKFAELLVKECIEVGNRAWLNDNSTFPTFPSEQIKEHFGVKEV